MGSDTDIVNEFPSLKFTAKTRSFVGISGVFNLKSCVLWELNNFR